MQTKCILGHTCHTYWAIMKCKTDNTKNAVDTERNQQHSSFPLYSNPLPSNLVTLRDEKFAIQSAKFVRSFGGFAKTVYSQKKTDKIPWLMSVGLALRPQCYSNLGT